jgi:hypothetical protein
VRVERQREKPIEPLFLRRPRDILASLPRHKRPALGAAPAFTVQPLVKVLLLS